MEIWKTKKEALTTDDIETYIKKHETERLPLMENLKQYHRGKNTTILKRRKPDENNPDNKTPVPYGRKLVTTFTGYAYRPGYITYKGQGDEDTPDMDALQENFYINNETIKTSRDGKNTGIYGVAYDLMYIDAVGDGLERTTEPRYFPIEPTEIILLYDFDSEPKKKIGIRYYAVEAGREYRVEVYYKDHTEFYDRTRNDEGKWIYSNTGMFPNFFDEIPIIPYYMGEDAIGIIEPVLPLIDDYDLLISDSLNEFDRFASAYLILKKMSIVQPELKKEAETYSRALALLRRRRVFENVPDTGDIKFLTKDIPKDFIEFMTTLVKNQIHLQSHVPDFADERFSGTVSGIAIQRMMFDFENVVSSAEADFDLGLQERIKLIGTIYAKTGRPFQKDFRVIISHKRNMPLNLSEFAETAVKMTQAGFSKYLVADIMPDDIIPDVEAELARQEEDSEKQMPDITNMGFEQPNETEETQPPQ